VTWFGLGWAQLEHVAAAGSPANVTIVVAVVVVAVWALRRDALAAVVCMAGPTLAGVFSVVAKHGVGRLHGSSLSYPSGHETLAAALGAAVVFAAWRLGGRRAGAVAAVVAVPYAALVGTALVRLGWHYPTDVIGGVAVGVGFVCAGAARPSPWARADPTETFPSDSPG
ncbi:MAG: phosphatase PAP2 family protein, partial [Acidimicrobiia bacterium]|nr:phosphatase PAP2 family protein [Acidimicrobiia bacterium]